MDYVAISATAKSNLVNQSEPNDMNRDYIATLDPKTWKSFDNYEILGIDKMTATIEDVNEAFKRMSLRYHPDVLRNKSGEPLPSHLKGYYLCVVKAYEELCKKLRARTQNSIPQMDMYNKSNFFKVFPPYFELLSPLSAVKNVPMLGNEDSSRQYVEQFYQFWTNFQLRKNFRQFIKEIDENHRTDDEVDQTPTMVEQRKNIFALVVAAKSCDPRFDRFVQQDSEKKKNKRNIHLKTQMIISGVKNVTTNVETNVNAISWTETEDKLLKKYLQRFSSSVSNRWNLIAELMPNRSKQDCLKRSKKLSKNFRVNEKSSLQIA